MGYVGKLELKIKAQSLRRAGLSYTQIRQHVTVSKDTLSRWCKEIELTDEQKNILINLKKLGQSKGSIVASENKRAKRKIKTKEIFIDAKKDIGDVCSRDEFIAGLCFYSAEGDKTDGKGGFTNADPRLIVFMMKWFRKYCKVPQERFRGALWIHSGSDISSALGYWSQLTGIATDKFHKTYVVPTREGRLRKQLHPYGVFAIRFSCSDIQRRILGWISAFFDDTISTSLIFPGSSTVEQVAVD